MTGMVFTLPQTPSEAAVPPRSRSGRCFILPASHNFCPCGFRGRLGYAQGLFPVFERPSGHLSAASSSVIQTPARAPCPRSDPNHRTHEASRSTQASVTFTHWKRSNAKGGYRRMSCKKDPPSPAPQLPAAAKQIEVINWVLYLLQPDSAEFQRGARRR